MAEFDHVIFYENPKSSRQRLAGQVADLLSGFGIDRVASKWPDAQANAEELAPRLDDGTCLVVAGGDGQLHAAVNAVGLAGKIVTVEAVKLGNSCDGAYTQHGDEIDYIADPQALPQLLREGQEVPVNSMCLTGVLDRWVALYGGTGLTSHGVAWASHSLLRQARDFVSRHGRYHKLGRGVDTMAVGGAIMWRTMCPQIDLQVNGQDRQVLDMSFVIGHRIAGTMRTPGDAFNQRDPTIACVEISRRSLLKHHAAEVMGAYFAGQVIKADYTAPQVDLTLPRNVLLHLDGENVRLKDGGKLRVAVDTATYHTLVSPERAAELAA